jgi:DNA-binding LacI/PurR family transcriptional regulator
MMARARSAHGLPRRLDDHLARAATRGRGDGLADGRDVSIVTFDDDLAYLRNGTDIPIFTSLRASVREMGRTAAQIVLDRIADRTLPPRQVLIEADLMVGQSTGPAPARGRAYEKG